LLAHVETADSSRAAARRFGMTRGVVLFVLVKVFARQRKNTSKAKTEKPDSKAAPFEKHRCGTPLNPSTVGVRQKDQKP
jgi:hypothetical protein